MVIDTMRIPSPIHILKVNMTRCISVRGWQIFHSELHCLPKYPFTGLLYKKALHLKKTTKKHFDYDQI